MTERDHLIYTLGTGNYKEAEYRVEDDGPTSMSRFVPVALVNLPDLDDSKVTILATQEAREANLPALREELGTPDIDTEDVEILEGRDREEQATIFRRVVDSIEPGERVHLDVTHALRHLPLLMTGAATYAASLEDDVELAGIYYGAWELGDDSTDPPTVPVLEATRWYRNLRWFHAVEAVNEGTNWTHLKGVLNEDVGELFEAGSPPEDLPKFKDAVACVVGPIGQGLPIEAGIKARPLLDCIDGLEEDAEGSPAGRFLAEKLEEAIEPWALQAEDKDQVSLDTEELSRQLAFATFLVERGEIAQALSLLREWLVNLVLFVTGHHDDWLDRDVRDDAAQIVKALAERAKEDEIEQTEFGAKVGRQWQAISKRRNAFMHAGMKVDSISVEGKHKKTLQFLNELGCLLSNVEDLDLAVGSGGRLLIGSLGYKIGALFTAAVRTQPDRILVLCSRETEGRVKETLEHIDEELERGVEVVDVIVLSEPRSGADEVEEVMAKKEHLPALTSAGEVVLNLAGGTSLMQHLVGRLGREAKRLGAGVRRGIVSDQRDRDEQEKDPFFVREWIELDGSAAEQEDV